eukprot:78017-Rhodomonas_salina.5
MSVPGSAHSKRVGNKRTSKSSCPRMSSTSEVHSQASRRNVYLSAGVSPSPGHRVGSAQLKRRDPSPSSPGR